MLCRVEQLGTVSYAEGLRLQAERVAARKTGEIPDTLLLLEHPHVYTLGRNAKRENLLISEDRLRELGAELFETNRGGDITYHGPGQLVGYPIFDLTQHRRDIAWFMRSLEDVFIGVAREFGIDAVRLAGAPGVWVGSDKLVAMGVHISRWVTSHGFAFNVTTDLGYFDHIVPCGLHNRGVTSLAQLLGRPLEMDRVADCVIEHFREVFGFAMELQQSKVESRK
jgi:lipoyl(octanoyl) transferase